MRIKDLIKIILSADWKFFPPKNKRILIYDAGVFNPFQKYLRNYGYNLFFKRGEQINVFIILKCLLQLDVSFFSYFRNYLKSSKPKIIITGVDNDPFFYKISKENIY